ncbi:hypothetical protein JYU34_013554 [Plutella xylostella]|uniref:Chitin-binding type-2 domain-containing protein n=1 Tax=Plutella xylostella TaxID=51655 RepID=A0ABQ7QAD2_PLUXY|nr:hypothetical protein JYU34_013554 [Plutella xylostella]
MNAWVSALLVAVCVAGALARSPLEQPAEPISPSEQASEPLSPWEQPAEPLSPSEQLLQPGAFWPPAPVEALDWLPNGCPARGDVPWLLPGWFCHQYWACSNGKKIPMRCPRGLHFNRLLQVCDYPESAGCRFIVWPWNKV